MYSRITKLTFILVALLALASIMAACSSKATPAISNEPPNPSNPGGPGEAVNLTGDAAKGADLFSTSCVSCHGDQGKGGVANPGSEDGTVPSLNPIESVFVSSDAKAYATAIDLYIEHGSTPEGSNPAKIMPALGDQKALTPQQIADLIAYIISLNKK
jgi:mono/diheme cytochrome c family protein